MLPPEVVRFIESKNFAYIATITRDGYPQVTPVWVDRDGDYILVNTRIGTAKQRNTDRNSKVAIVITDASNPYTSMSVRGTADQVTDGAEQHLDKLAKKYKGLDRYPEDRRRGRVILRIKPELIIVRGDIWSKDYFVREYRPGASG